MLPLKNAIIEILNKEKVMTDDELFSELQKRFKDITEKDLYRELLKLEVLGLVKVFEAGKGRKRIELAAGSSVVVGEFDF